MGPNFSLGLVNIYAFLDVKKVWRRLGVASFVLYGNLVVYYEISKEGGG